MATAERWRELHDRFIALAHQEQAASDVERPLTAYGTYGDEYGPCGNWHISWGPKHNKEYFQSQFELVATDAGIEIQESPKETPPGQYWLHALYAHLRDNESSYLFPPKSVSDQQGVIITNLCEASALLCTDMQINERESTVWPPPVVVAASTPPKPSRRELFNSYLRKFHGEKIVILDICWAAGQHYSEWKRWLRKDSPLRDGSTPDLAFRGILTSGKRPIEFRSSERPDGWK